ncbi:MAG TPA: hypothetical protein VFJ71_02540 [Candidatus Limnocylindrales bacterium]|nr:hypothetical protein [Candidatus Limnocylindrales bacterium]
MTNLDDFDRALDAFLRDGPTIAPEPPVIAALAHARATPRRWDPFASLRRDVMARPVRIGGLRPGLVLGAAGLVLVALGLALLGGGRRNEDAPPAPSTSPTASASSTASASPSASASAVFSRSVRMLVAAGDPLTVDVRDTSGFLVDATSLQPGDGASVGETEVRIEGDPADDAALIVTWMGLGCEATGAAFVDEGAKVITITRQPCSGDTFPLDRVLRLAFASQVDVSAWRGIVALDQASAAPTGGPGEASPSAPPADATIILRETPGDRTILEIADQSGHFASATVSDEPGTREPLTATNVDDRRIRLEWFGEPCDSIYRLTIAADFGLALDKPHCSGDSIASAFAIELVFDQTVDADAIDTSLQEGAIGSGLPTWTMTGIDADDHRYDLALFDGSGIVAHPEDATFNHPQDPAPAAYALGQASPTKIRLSWIAPACDNAPILAIDSSATHWELRLTGCGTPSSNVLRTVDIELTEPRTIDTIDVMLVTADG